MSWLRKRSRLALILGLCVALPLVIGCSDDKTTAPPPDDDDPPPVTGNITGTVILTPGINGDLRNARVAVYASFDDWNNDRVLKSIGAQGTESQVSFTITGLAPGTYYVDFWKDMDNNGFIDFGDIFGVHGTIQWPQITVAPLSVIAGQSAVASIIIIAIP